MTEEKSYREPKESIRMMKSRRSDTKINNLIEERKRKCIIEIIGQNTEVLNNAIILSKIQQKYRKHKSKNFKR